MKYIDGIKTCSKYNIFCQKLVSNFRQLPVKHIPIYEPMTKKRILHLTSTSEDISGVKWIDGQPYELITLNRSKD